MMQNENWPVPEWRTTDPGEQGMDRALPEKLRSVITSEYANTNGIVVVRNGCIVCEEYFHGFGPDVPVHVASVTKSVLSALTGIAVDKGYIPSVSRKIMEYLPDYVSETHNRNCGNVTIENLLTMTVPYAFEEWKEPLEQLCTSPDWVGFTLDMMRDERETDKPRRHFQYCTAGAHLLSAVLQRAVGMSTREFANRYLFEPVGMTVIPDYPMEAYTCDSLFGEGVRGWVHDPDGVTAGGWGLTMTPRDMARLGLLYLNMGRWNGARIISEAWVRQSVKRTFSRYGYMWWRFEKKGVAVHAAMGDGGNMICWVPDRNLVAAIASGFVPEAKNRWLLVRDYILPAVEENRV